MVYAQIRVRYLSCALFTHVSAHPVFSARRSDMMSSRSRIAHLASMRAWRALPRHLWDVRVRMSMQA